MVNNPNLASPFPAVSLRELKPVVQSQRLMLRSTGSDKLFKCFHSQNNLISHSLAQGS